MMLTERLANLVTRHARRRGLNARRVEDIGGFYVHITVEATGETFDAFDFDDYRLWLRRKPQALAELAD